MRKFALVIAVLFLLPIFAACLSENTSSDLGFVSPSVEFPEGTTMLSESQLNEEQRTEVLRMVNEALKAYADGGLPLDAEVSSVVIPQLTHLVPSSAYMPTEASAEQIYLQVYEDLSDGEESVQDLPPDYSDISAGEQAPPAGTEQAENAEVKAAVANTLQNEPAASQPEGEGTSSVDGTDSTPPSDEEWPESITATLKEASMSASIVLSDLYIFKVDIAGDMRELVSPKYELADVNFVDGIAAQLYENAFTQNGGIFSDLLVSRAAVTAGFSNMALAGIVPTLNGTFVWDKNDGLLRIWLEEHGYFCFSVVDGKTFGETEFPILTDNSALGIAGGRDRFNYIEVGQLGQNMFTLIQKTLETLPN